MRYILFMLLVGCGTHTTPSTVIVDGPDAAPPGYTQAEACDITVGAYCEYVAGCFTGLPFEFCFDSIRPNCNGWTSEQVDESAVDACLETIATECPAGGGNDRTIEMPVACKNL